MTLRQSSAVARILALMFVFSSAVAFAQQAPLATQPAAPQAAPAEAAIAPSHLAVAREVVLGSGLARNFESMVPQIAEQIRSGFSRTRPEIIKDMEESLKSLIVEYSKQSDLMVTASARLYAKRLSEAELREISTFLKTPSGQKYISSQSEVLNELFAEMQVFSQALGNELMDRLRSDLRKKNIQL
ncbi:MAG: DUF2059 domain-containing protein [Beijerinckiaceae bacterium]